MKMKLVEGLKDFQEIIEVPLKGYMAYDQAMANDGKINLADIPYLIQPLMALPAAIADANLALEQWKLASPAMRAALHAEVVTSFDIVNDKVEAKVEAAVGILTNLGLLLS